MRTLVLAHRGVADAGPENSLAAFKALSSIGADGVELDVQVTADDVAVVAHDLSLGGRRIEQLTYEAVLGVQGTELSQDARIPTLRDVLGVVPDNLLVNLEVKSLRAVPALLSAIRDRHSRYNIVVTSFDAEPLVVLRREAPEIRTGLVAGMHVEDLLGWVRNALADVVSLQWRLATEPVIDQMHDNGVGVYVWTVNSASAAERMIAAGVDAIITDEPREILPLAKRARRAAL